MSSTTLQGLEERLSDLNKQLDACYGETSTKQLAADDLVLQYREKGVDILRDPKAAKAVKAAYEEADQLGEHAKKLRAEALEVAEAMAQSTKLPGVASGRAPWTLTMQGVEILWHAARAGQGAKVGHDVGSRIFAAADFGDPVTRAVSRSYELLPVEPTRIADYLPAVPTAAPIVHFHVMTSDADQAAAVAAGADKPESSPVFVEQTAEVVKVAHFAKVQDEVLKDLSTWRQVLGDVMIRGLIQEENRQLLTADGTGEDMVGLVPSAGLSITRDTTNESRLDCILRAITALRTESFLEATVIVLHPDDYYETRVEKSTLSGEYLSGDPLTAAPDRLWGYPVVVTTGMTEGTGLVANLAAAGNVYWREPPIFEVHPGGGGLAEWKANMTLVRAEERFVLAVIRPEALVEVNAL